ncbi:MAG: glycine cleavage system aminomethyltransferase GcvT [Chloroflexi bacterium]|nr:glycine cleavage system aminomethyltransferase GcvT [Chloroflexota bacterium]
MDSSNGLKRTPLFDTHVSLGGRMVPFAGWEMPIQYASILDEAKSVRSKAGLFDVSHMGRVEIEGPGAAEFLNRILSVDVLGLRMGRARYNVICNEQGGIIDDCIVYRRGNDKFLLIPNASNTPPVLDWLARWSPGKGRVKIENVTSRLAMIAHQGPQALAMLQRLTSVSLSEVRPFASLDARVEGVDALIARTGYTGEDGFEIILPSEAVPNLWKRLMDLGAAACGLGARDVLRLEAGLLLHGNDMDTTINPYEAGLERFVDPDRPGYVAGEALRRVRDEGPSRKLVGFNMVGRGIPRHGYAIRDGSKEIGFVSSGGHSPTLDRSIGLGYVPTSYAKAGARFQVDIRGRLVEAEVTSIPFYSRRRSA